MHRSLAAAVCAAIVTAAPLWSQAPAGRRALAIEDYYRVLTVGDPALSPDGRWVSYSVAERVESDNSTKSSAWLLRSDAAAAPRRVQHEGKDVSALRWTDGHTLQYSVDRQTWAIDPDNPSAAPARVEVPAAVEGAAGGRGGRGGRGSAGLRSPDGVWIAQAVDKPQATREPSYASDFEKRHQERFKGAIFDWKDFQRDGAAFPVPNPVAQPAQQVVIRPAAGGEPRVLVDKDLRPSGITWHPNGRLLAFTADSDWRDELKYSRADLWTVTIDGVVTRLTDDPYVYSGPAFSPDGKYLSYTRTYGTDMIIEQKLNHGGPEDLYVRPLAGGEPINLTASWDLEPGATRWSPDSRFIYFTAEIGGESHLFRIAVPDGKAEQITKGPRRLGALGFDKAMTKIVYTVGVHDAPADVYVAGIDGTNERRLTDVNKTFTGEVALSRTERLQWSSNDGTKIEGWLMFPYGYDPSKGPYPMIVTSHGGPHSATGYGFNFKNQYFAANGYFVLDTNFRSSTGYGDRFKWATWGAWGDKDGQDVVSGIDYVLKRYPIDAKRVGHTGHSYGGFMTNWLITQYPDRFAAAITGAGISNWISDYGTADIYRTKETEFFGTPWDDKARAIMIRQSPLTYAGRVRTPTMFVHGEVDQRVPYEEGEQLYFALKRRGVPAKMIQYQGQPHGIAGHWNNVHRMLNELAWWEKYLKPVKAPTTNSQGPKQTTAK
jgi:dipeptidyl aminopeptidase/acylaminoacyl peptidase